MSNKESVKSLIQKRIYEELGFETSVSYDSETGDVVVKRRLRVTKNPVGVNQIDIDDASSFVNHRVKYGDFIEMDMDDNMMVNVIIRTAVSEAEKAEDLIRRKQEIIESLRIKGITDHSLIFPIFQEESMIGDAKFILDNEYEVIVSKDRRMEKDRFEVGREYPMIVLSIEKRNSGIVIQASRVTSALVEELIRMSLVNVPIPVDVIKTSRIPGKMSKVVVSCEDPRYNPTAVVVGKDGMRINSVESYINGEKIEIVNYSPSTPLQMAELIRTDRLKGMHFYFEAPQYFETLKTLNKKKIIVIVDDTKVGQVVGKGGVSLCLTDKLSGWVVRVLKESEFYEDFPEGIPDTTDFDWMGLDDLPEYARRFYGFYLRTVLGARNPMECLDFDVLNYQQVKEFSKTDCEFIYGYIQNITFACPNCGEEIKGNATSCPHCGAIFQEEGEN